MKSSEFVIQWIGEAVQGLSPLGRLNYLVPVTLGIVAVLFAFPDLSNSVKGGVAVVVLASLVIVVNYVPNRLRESIEVLLKIQTEVFFAREKVDDMDEAGVRQLLEILRKVEVPKSRGGLTLHQLETNGLELIRASKRSQ
ncbi:MAG: hypothetical protein ABSG45_09005 [Nitrososphaerales archaeon]|jgi:hypothetical protein